MKILAINPGSTSTKIGLFDEKTKIFERTIRHSAEELIEFSCIADQKAFRKDAIMQILQESGTSILELGAVACRGGASKPVEGGTYLVNDALVTDLIESPIQHPSNLASIIGKEIADEIGIKAYFTDAPVTYELSKLAAYSGHKSITRKGRFHALNQKAIARQFAEEHQKTYEDVNVIVCHMGGGITIGAHQKGRTVDVTDAISEGPFTPERCGSLPTRELVDMCFSGQFSYSEMKSFIQGKGGVFSYLNTIDMCEVEEKALKEDPLALEVMNAMAYQISKQIASMSAVLNGHVDGILLTGGIAYSQHIVAEIEKRVGFIAAVKSYPGEIELEALALGTLRVVHEVEEAKSY